MTDDIDLITDLDAQDDEGLGWATLTDAGAPDQIVTRAMVLAGNHDGHTVALTSGSGRLRDVPEVRLMNLAALTPRAE